MEVAGETRGLARGGDPRAGYFTKRLAEDWLREMLAEARRGALPGIVRSGVTFADAAAEWLGYVSEDGTGGQRR